VADVFPPPPIQAPPAGWLGLLGIKSGGKQPGRVLEGMQPTLEMLLFYLAGTRVTLARPLGLAAVQNGQTVMATVPNGKVWIVDSFVMNSGGTNVAGAHPQAALQSINAGNVFMAPQGQPTQVGEEYFSVLQGPLIALPGESFVAFTNSPVAVPALTWSGAVWGREVAA
jgi:hypothetical protein